MLAGIKTGKRKAKRKDPPGGVTPEASNTNTTIASSIPATDANASIAELLRQSFQQKPAGSAHSASARHPASDSSAADSSKARTRNFRSLEERGRIQRPTQDAKDAGVSVFVRDSCLPELRSNDHELTIAQMVAQERVDQGMSLNEKDTRNILRNNKNRKEKRTAHAADSDDEVHQQLQSQRQGDAAKVARRDYTQQLARQDKQQGIAAKCWWWLESPTFQRNRLLALGDHVTLVMAPSNRSLIPGAHFYLVPIQHAPSLTSCEDDDVWNEIHRFQSSLRNMFAQNNKAVLFCETVLPSAIFWQTKMECLVVPMSTAQEAPLYFKNALAEQADEWGTHQKLLHTSGNKGLRRTIPKNFPYVYLEYDRDQTGYAQMIESSSSHTSFPPDFCVDTVAGMMQMDPMRFRKRVKADANHEMQCIRSFLDEYKAFDWTLDLDS
jgi:hypothetical protein